MNPQSGETTERSRYSKSIMSYKNQTENETYGTSQPEIQERSSNPEIASDFKDSDEYGSSDPTLEDTVKMQSNDPRSPMRKLLDLILEMRDVDLENCLHVYQEMMEFKDPTTFTREEEYSICKKALTEIHGKTESRYRQEKDQFWSERDQLQKKVDELCVKVEAFEKKENHSQAQAPLGEKIDKIKQETREKNSFGEIEKESKVNEDIGKFQRQLESEQETDKKLGKSR
ncbi:uncharacterized protein LOC134274008 [Saccostrea cucullata]|uniref:uncharacterized protein LOC134274008 n=1 Tax=Saccostrea cuccullata TaxID=36930 RepID=UPI002ED2F249